MAALLHQVCFTDFVLFLLRLGHPSLIYLCNVFLFLTIRGAEVVCISIYNTLMETILRHLLICNSLTSAKGLNFWETLIQILRAVMHLCLIESHDSLLPFIVRVTRVNVTGAAHILLTLAEFLSNCIISSDKSDSAIIIASKFESDTNRRRCTIHILCRRVLVSRAHDILVHSNISLPPFNANLID